MSKARVNWLGDEVLLNIQEATSEGLFVFAQEVVDQAKINITDNQQIDTGFMRNSGYAVGQNDSTYDQIDTSGTFRDREGQQVKRTAAPEETLPGSEQPQAAAAFAAEYTLYQEEKDPFLYPALEQVSDAELEAILKAEAKKKGG